MALEQSADMRTFLKDPADPSKAADCDVNDPNFIRDLTRLKELRSFLIQEAIDISGGDGLTLSFGSLNLLQFSEKGRAPTLDEWAAVERLTQSLFRLLTGP